MAHPSYPIAESHPGASVGSRAARLGSWPTARLVDGPGSIGPIHGTLHEMETRSMRAEIISIGSELVSGQSLDTNSQWLSRSSARWESRSRSTRRSATSWTRTSRRSGLACRPGRPGRHDRRPGADAGRPDARGPGRSAPACRSSKTPRRSRRSRRCSPGGTARWPSGTGSRPCSPRGPSRCRTRRHRAGHLDDDRRGRRSPACRASPPR